MRLLVAEVALDVRTAGAGAVYTYSAPKGSEVGAAHLIALGPRREIGYVIAVREIEEDDLGFEVDRLKPIGPRVVGLDLPPACIELARFVAEETLSPFPVALSLAMPPGARSAVSRKWEATGLEPDGRLPVAQDEALRILREGSLSENKARKLPDGTRKALLALTRLGLARQVVALVQKNERKSEEVGYRLVSDTSAVESFLTGPGKRRPAQSVTVMAMQGAESALTKREIRALAGVTDQTVKALLEAKLLEAVTAEDQPLSQAPVPHEHQAAAIAAIVPFVEAQEFKPFLLYGVTGSGKTEVFLRCAEAALRQGRQVLYLVPEIALTAQMIGLLRGRFGQRVAVMHSNMTATERMDNWRRVRDGRASVVLGARSALFAPFEDLGLVVMDEEHEASYKQESSPRYHAKLVARFLATRFKCPLVLGSATPSIESFVEAQSGATQLLRMPARAASAKLPEVEIVDLKELYKERKAALLSPPLFEAIDTALGRGEQAILFLNRRAYAPFVVCRDCGYRFTCTRCSVALCLHRSAGNLQCHQCDYQTPMPEICPQCAGVRVGAFGVGVEKVEETVAALWPHVKVARLDRDVVQRKGALEEIMASFRSGETNVLVGTQMVAKGLDFPNVTVVGVIAADISLNIPDFRASERTFQLLSQVAGRAGRGSKPGRVVIQTLSPDHVSVVCAQSHDYESLFAAVSTERREAGYPPYVRLVNIVVTGKVRAAVVQTSAIAAQRLARAVPEAEVLGPVDCTISKIQDMHRRHVMVKLPVGTAPSVCAAALEGLDSARVRVVVDADPYSLI